MLEIEPGGKVVEATCDHCGKPMTRVTGFVHQDGDAHAIYFASCYQHDRNEVWIDGVFSPTWADEAEDRFTFGCRVGVFEGQSEPGASLVAAAAAFGDSATFGHKITRDEALVHPALGDFWALVDHVLTNDRVVSTFVYGPGAQFD